jgi:flagellar P-ring protein precursor FlgI
VLLQTPLKAANGNVYALAQGQIFSVKSPSGTSRQTVGTIPRGAIIEQDVISEFLSNDTLSLILRNPDFVTANTVSAAIRQEYPDIELRAVDAAMVELTIPPQWRGDPVAFIAQLESIEVTPEPSNRVVIDSSSGVIIFGERVRIGQVAVSYKDISVSVSPYRRPTGGLWDEEEAGRSFVFEETTSVETLVETLRSIGLETEVIIYIIKAIDRAGSLYGTLIVN